MLFYKSKQRIYASLFILGIGFLLFRTITMISQGDLSIMVPWVSLLLITELLIDSFCVCSSVIWWLFNNKSKSILALRSCAAAIIVHAIRVFIFVMGRIGPWIDFDVKPEHRALHYTRWSWEGVYLAAILSTLSIIGLLVIWQLIKKTRRAAVDNIK